MKTNKTVFSPLGASTHSKFDREKDDYYATPPRATEELLKLENFNKKIWEPACGGGHISEVLKAHGFDVISTDLFDRNYGETGVDFLTEKEVFSGDIITNPPYSFAQEFVEKSLELIPTGNKVAMFLKIQFLEGQNRRKLFSENPPKTVYVSSARFCCSKNGEFKKNEGSAVAYCWFVWEKGFKGSPQIKWFN